MSDYVTVPGVCAEYGRDFVRNPSGQTPITQQEVSLIVFVLSRTFRTGSLDFTITRSLQILTLVVQLPLLYLYEHY